VACADGWVGINPLNLQGWNDLCAVSGLSEYHDRMREVLASDAASEEFRARVSTWCRDLDADAVVELAQ
jgi:hypothetical protein